MLCIKCNTVLGTLGDDVAGLQRALDYVGGAKASHGVYSEAGAPRSIDLP